MCSETSPRISFSNDLLPEEDDQDEVRRDIHLLLESSSNSDFEFSICSSLHHQSSSADELFADGIILPAADQTHTFQSLRNVSLPPIPYNSKREEEQELEDRSILEDKNQIQSKSFWGFKRSSSLNCDIKKSLICSLPLLSRSNSTGSAPNSKLKSKEINKQNSQIKQQSGKKSGSGYVYSWPQKPPLKKYYGGSNGGVNKVLNVPPPYIGKGAASLFGLGSFLRHGNANAKDKIRR